jgi:hypothetical protein
MSAIAIFRQLPSDLVPQHRADGGKCGYQRGVANESTPHKSSASGIPAFGEECEWQPIGEEAVGAPNWSEKIRDINDNQNRSCYDDTPLESHPSRVAADISSDFYRDERCSNECKDDCRAF